MKIFIDESGNFIGDQEKYCFSCVGALIVPTLKYNNICSDFSQIVATWPKVKGEVKGRTLNAQQISDIARMLRKHDCLLEIAAIDLNVESEQVIEVHKTTQAELLTAQLTEKHHPNMVKYMWELRKITGKLPNQLYIQSVLLTELISRTIQHSTLYYAQRKPSELGKFQWVIDAKDKKLTPYEKWWKRIVLPLLQTKSLREPTMLVKDKSFNYGYFNKEFSIPLPDFLKEVKIRVNKTSNMGSDIKKIMKDLTFMQSHNETGLQLVDILVSGMRKLLHGKIDRACINSLGQLMIVKGVQNLSMLTMIGKDRSIDTAEYKPIVKALGKSGRMLLKQGTHP